jgi:hypothetical protein
MPIVMIKGQAKSGKTTLARALRQWQISHRSGCLILDENPQAFSVSYDLTANIEKLLRGASLPPAELISDARGVMLKKERGKPETEIILRGIDALPWKPNCMVVIVGDQEGLLTRLDHRCPGFVEKFGPVWEWTAKVAGATYRGRKSKSTPKE